MLIDNTRFGLSERDFKTITDILHKYPEVLSVDIFGSRAKGNYKPFSDIDLAVINEGVDIRTISHILADMEESTLPYKIDLVYFPSIVHVELKEHILRVGLPLYRRDSQA